MSATHAWGKIPEHLRGGLARYLIFGVRPGGALTAFLENDLFEFAARSSDETLAGIKPMATFLYNYTPCGCYGHAGVVENWMSLSQVARVVSMRHAGCTEAFEAMGEDAGAASPQEMLAADYVIVTVEERP